jgi:hypothetical protein
MAKTLSVKILESDREIFSKVNTALAKEFDKNMRKNGNIIKNRIRPIIASALFKSPEIMSLSGGVLQADFGLTFDPAPDIVQSIVSTIKLNARNSRASGNSIDGGFTLTIQPIDYSNLFSLSVAEQVIEGGSIPWLKWLLTLGDAIIIADFGVKYGPFGRTGQAHMTYGSRPFKVNSSFSGTANNNFITKAINASSSQIKDAIIGVFK